MRITIDPVCVANTFSRFSANPSLQESAQLFAQGLPVAEMIQAMAMNQNVLQTFAGFEAIYPNGNLERRILEKVILRVSQLHQCQFCTESHLAIMKGLRINTDVSHQGEHTERERLALEYAEQMTRDANQVSDALFSQMRKAFTDPEIVELTFHVGFITLLNRFNNALQIAYHGEFGKVTIH